LSRVVRARYENGVLRPLEDIGLREGEEVLVKIERLESGRGLSRSIKGLWGI
jgi:predicted DNA-binding antitoxin AbrB/MazE fold protein